MSCRVASMRHLLCMVSAAAAVAVAGCAAPTTNPAAEVLSSVTPRPATRAAAHEGPGDGRYAASTPTFSQQSGPSRSPQTSQPYPLPKAAPDRYAANTFTTAGATGCGTCVGGA